MIWPKVGIVHPRSIEVVSIVLLERERNEMVRNYDKLGPNSPFYQRDKFVIEWCEVSNQFCKELLTGDPDEDQETLHSLWNAAYDLGQNIYKRSIRVQFSNSSPDIDSNNNFFPKRIAMAPSDESFPSPPQLSRQSQDTAYYSSPTSSGDDLIIPSLSQQQSPNSYSLPHNVSMDISTTECHSSAGVMGSITTTTSASSSDVDDGQFPTSASTDAFYDDRFPPSASSVAFDNDQFQTSASTGALYDDRFLNVNSNHKYGFSSSVTRGTEELQILAQQRDDLLAEVDNLRQQFQDLMTEKYELENQVDQMNKEMREQLKESHRAVHKWRLRRHLVCPMCTEQFSSHEDSANAPLSSSSCGHTVCRSCVEETCRAAAECGNKNASAASTLGNANRRKVKSSAAALLSTSCNSIQITLATGESTACPLCGAWNAFMQGNLNQSLRGVISLLETSKPRYRC